MPRISVTLPDYLHEFVAAEVAERGGKLSAGEFIVQQIGRAYDEKYQAQLETLLLEGLNSGPSEPFTREDWAAIRKEGMRRVRALKRTHGTSRKKARSRS
jgi:antitoxin ParD1/3/4